MPLHDDIAKEIESGRLPQRWTTDDLVNNQFLKDKYEKTTLRTAPPNQSMSLPGLDLGNGAYVNTRNPTYYRVDRKHALLFALPQHIETGTNPSESDPALTISAALSDETGIEAIVEDDAPLMPEQLPAQMGSSAYEMLELLVKDIHEEEPWDSRLHNYVWNKRNFFQTSRGSG